MGIGAIGTLGRVYCLGRAMHPGFTPNHLKHQIILMARAVAFLPDFRNWFDISDNPLLSQALRRFPLINGAIYWPYINHKWPMQRRLSTIDQHFRMLVGPASIVARATFEEVELARFDGEYPGLRLVLDKAMWFVREGEIVLNLFVNDQRFYSVAFTLGVDGGQPLIYVGALQGVNSATSKEIYREITRALYGMRPRDILVTALKQLCQEFGIYKIWAISSDSHQHNSPYFGGEHKEKVLVSYNEVWTEHGGTELENGFFEIPAIVRYKDMSEISTKKRAAYRRRYAMLDKLGLDIKASCAQYAPKEQVQA